MALRCFPPERRDWAEAMAAEFDIVMEDARALPFALGCLAMAWRDLPRHRHGRFMLANHALVLGVIVPLATFHLACAVSGARFLLRGPDHYYRMLMVGDLHQQSMAQAYREAMPVLAVLLLLLGAGHLLIAWNALACRWRRVMWLWFMEGIVAAALVAAITLTIPSALGMAVQLAALGVELCALPLLARWHGRVTF